MANNLKNTSITLKDIAERAGCSCNTVSLALRNSTRVSAATRNRVKEIAEQHNLIQKSDAGELEAIVAEVLAENAKAIADVIAGGKKSKKAMGFLLGQVMQKTRGQANPKVVSQILAKKLV